MYERFFKKIKYGEYIDDGEEETIVLKKNLLNNFYFLLNRTTINYRKDCLLLA